MTLAGRAPEPTAVLTVDEVATWLRVSPRTVLRWHVPALVLGPKTKRYLARDVFGLARVQGGLRGSRVLATLLPRYHTLGAHMPKAKPAPRRQLAVRIPADLYRALKVHAAKTDTPVLVVVEAALRAYLKGAA